MKIEEMGECTVRARLATMVHKNAGAKLIALLVTGLAVVIVYFFVCQNQRAQNLLDLQKVVFENGSGIKAIVDPHESGPEILLSDAQGILRINFHVKENKTLMVLKNSHAMTHFILSGGRAVPTLSIGETQETAVNLNLENLGPNFGFYGAGPRLNLKPVQSEGKMGFEILDGHNQARISLGLDESTAVLSFLDEQGRVNTQARVDVEGVHLLLMDSNNLVRARGSIKNDETEMTFFDSLGRKRAGIISENGSQNLVFFDDSQVAREAIALGTQNINFKLLDFEVPAPEPTLIQEVLPTVSLLVE